MKHPAHRSKTPAPARAVKSPRTSRVRSQPNLPLRELHRKAEAELVKRGTPRKPNPAARKRDASPERLLHELQVHQIELEMQNAALQDARDQAGALLDKYTDLYDFAPVGYFSLDGQGNIVEANLTGAAQLGVERSMLLGHPFRHFVAPTSHTLLMAFLRRVFTGKGRESCEVALTRADAAAWWGGLQGTLATSATGPPGRCWVAVSDITVIRAADDAVRASEVRYRRLFEAAHDGVLLVDPDTRRITDANPYAVKLLGCPHWRLVGRELVELGVLENQAASREMFRKLRLGREVCYEVPLPGRKGGHLRSAEMVANLYHEGRHALVQINIRDITERKQTEELLRRNEALFSALIAQAPVGVYAIDAGFRVRQVNPKALEVFGKVNQLIGRDFSEVIQLLWPKRVADRIVARFRHTLKTGDPYDSRDFEQRRRDTGQKECYEWQIRRVVLPAGEYGVVCFYSDVTERKRAEAVRRRLEMVTASNQKLEAEIARRLEVERNLRSSRRDQIRLLAEARQMQGQLRQLSRSVLRVQEDERRQISRELHDVIVQTLTGINVHLGILKREAALNRDRLDARIESTQRLVEQSVEIVHRFARDLRPAVLDDLGLGPALQTFIRHLSERTGLRIELNTAAGVDRLDPVRRTVLFRVAQEALTNVVRHAGARHATVHIELLPKGACMRIADDGRAFDVERALRATRGKRLGLLGMRERMEMVGGRLAIESTPGQGTTITARMPFNQNQRLTGANNEMPTSK